MLTAASRVLAVRGFGLFALFLSLFLAMNGAMAQTTALDAEEQAFVKLINEYRAQNGLSALRVSVALTQSSKWMSADMIARNYFPFNHVDSLGRDPFQRMTQFNYGYNTWRGENIAAGYGEATYTFQQWKNSASHNANMLNPNYNVIGVGRGYGATATYRWYWTTDFGGYVDATIEAVQPNLPRVVTVNSANYRDTVSSDSIASAYGTNLASVTLSATTRPLPTSLGNISVSVEGQLAQLLYVSPTQINYIVPQNVAPGVANVRVQSGNGLVLAGGTVNISPVSPSLFTLSASGLGVPTGLTTYNGVVFEPISNLDGTARPLSVGNAANPNFLILFGTGIRYRSAVTNVTSMIGGVPAEVMFAGAQGDFVGLDQVNIKIPASLRGRGQAEVVLWVDGREANRVMINIGN
ncbi:MAG: CAP domain-containing protein [Blastocatellia bacterium]